ncbi:MAG: ice-binding family protein [Ignavibacteriales bacterium]|nr:ice-binding family protein [Ignavibacteriales bacterium]
MKTTNSINKLSRWVRLFGSTLTIILMVYAVAVSQLGPAQVNLGTAGNYVILAKTGISSTGTTAIVGDIALSPAAASFITGFGITAPPTTFAISSLVTGKIYAADYDPPTPTILTTAVGDMLTAYTDAAGRAPDSTELGTGSIGGKTLTPGVYKWTTSIVILTDVTISGGQNDIWIFQTSGDITLANAKAVILSGGAQAKNIFWQVAGQVTLGTTSHFEGIIMCQTLIALNTGASINGRMLAQTAVTLDANAVTQPATATAVETGAAPQKFTLSQNYPNPFNPSTKIQYSLEKAGMVSLKIFNMLGGEVATLVNTRQEAGSYTVPFNTSEERLSLASGVYFYRLESGSFVSVKKLVLMK